MDSMFRATIQLNYDIFQTGTYFSTLLVHSTGCE